MPVETARNITNKFFQRQLFIQNYPEITVPFKKIRTFHGAYTFSRRYGFPIIVKPANLSQGKLVHICNNLEELIKNVSYVLDKVTEVYEKQNVRRKPQVIIEKFIDGQQYSVDSYIDVKGNITHTPVCKQVISHDLGFDDFQTYYSGYPSHLSPKKEQEVLDTVSKAIKSLKVVGTVTHVEVKVTSKNIPKIIEVNIRPGGYRASMLLESYDTNHILNVVNTYTNKPVEVKEKFLKHSACPQFWAEKKVSL
ncbi:MAG: ATP-grasp domain-containing protein [Thermales bacterium]|nr:ATP-grasp domain-containing protein [Thermales bacterium]